MLPGRPREHLRHAREDPLPVRSGLRIRRLRRRRRRHPSQLGLSRARQREGKVRPRGQETIERLRDRRVGKRPLLLARRAAHGRPPRRRRLRQQPLTQAGLTHTRLATDHQDPPAPLRRSSPRSPGGRQLRIATHHRRPLRYRRHRSRTPSDLLVEGKRLRPRLQPDLPPAQRSDARTGAARQNDRQHRRICASASDAPPHPWAPQPPPPPTVHGPATTASTPASAAHAPHLPTRHTDLQATAPRCTAPGRSPASKRSTSVFTTAPGASATRPP